MRMRLNNSMALLVTACMAMLMAAPAAAEAPDTAGTCADCHGDNGVSSDGAIPTIAGASDFFLENQLFIFQEEARPCAAGIFGEKDEQPAADDHCALVKELSEDQIVELAGYYAGLPFVPAEQPVDQALASQGASIHERNCARCHTDGGSLALDDAGILAGQWKPYLLAQLEHYKAGERWQPETMQPQIDALGEQDMKALVEYYAGQGAERFQ